MSNGSNHMNYTAEDIEKYLLGKLSSQQRHAMEKAALDDPFLAEAMEGYEAMKDKDWKEQFVQARQQIARAGTGAKAVPIHVQRTRWWRIAAAVLLIGGGASIPFLFTQKEPAQSPGQQIAKAETGTSPTLSEQKSSDSLTAPAGKNTGEHPAVVQPGTIPGNGQTVVKADEPTSLKKNFLDKPINTQNTDSLKREAPPSYVTTGNAGVVSPKASPSPAKPEPVTVASSESIFQKDSKEADAVKVQEENAEMAKRKTALSTGKSDKNSNRFFNAQIVTPDNSPLPFSNVSVKSGSFETYADVKGNFRLFSTDSLLTVEVKSIGYQPRTYQLKSNLQMNKIVLQETEADPTDNRNGDVGLNGKLRRASVLSDTSINVEPKDGWENYNTYVANNLDIPDEMLKNGFHGEVELSFDVKPNGSISNIRISKSLGPEYDEAAKRLIMQGPQWKIKKGKRTSASVKVKF